MKQKILDILIVLALMAVSVLAKLPTLSLPGMSYSDLAEATDDAGYPYLSDPDSYYFLRHVEDYAAEDSILPHAIPDDLRVSPSGDTETFDFFAYSMSLVYRLVHLFADIPVSTFVVFAAPFLYSLSIIPAYIFIKKRTNRFGAIFAGLLVGLNPAYYVDTNISCFDSDIVLFILPLTFACLFIEALEAETRQKYLISSLFSLFFLALLFLSWGTADVYLYLLLGFFAVYFVWKWIEKKSFRLALHDPITKRSGLYILAAMLVVFICRGTLISSAIISAATSILGLTESSAVPSPAKYVSELSSPTFLVKTDWYSLTSGSIVSDVGGAIVFFVAIITLIYLGFRACIDRKQGIFTFFFLWFAGTLLAASIANRFTKLLAIPISILAAYGLGIFYTYMRSHLFAGKYRFTGTYVFFACFLIVIPFLGVALSSKSFHNSSNDTVVAASRYIRDQAESDTSPLIVSWWDDGYILEYESGVRCLMDGGTYDGHFYQRVAQALLSSDPEDGVAHLQSFLDELDLHPDHIYIPMPRKYTTLSSAIEYYANFGVDGEPYHMDGSIMKRMTKEEKLAPFRHLATIGQYYIYALDLQEK